MSVDVDWERAQAVADEQRRLLRKRGVIGWVEVLENGTVVVTEVVPPGSPVTLEVLLDPEDDP